MKTTIKALLTRGTSNDLSEEEIRDLSRAIARRARAARYPLKSLAAVEREARGAGIEEELLRMVMTGAVDLLEGPEQGSEGKPQPRGQWLSPLEAAGALGVAPGWVLEHLDTASGRRLLGYPFFDGRRWHVPAGACDSNTRAAYLADLPDSEPAENVTLLGGAQ